MDMLRKLKWEIDSLRPEFGTDAYAYVAINMATTAFHTLDWITCEITARNQWPRAIKKFQLDISAESSESDKLKAIQKYARECSESMRVCEQIANASKHRDLRNMDEQIETISEKLSSGSDYSTRRVLFAQSVEPEGGIFMRGPTLLGMDAHGWLERFMDQAGTVGARID
jgi:hypothetical protein